MFVTIVQKGRPAESEILTNKFDLKFLETLSNKNKPLKVDQNTIQAKRDSRYSFIVRNAKSTYIKRIYAKQSTVIVEEHARFEGIVRNFIQTYIS